MAPTDEAFRMLPKSVLEYLGKNMTALMEVLMYHAIPDSEVSTRVPYYVQCGGEYHAILR